MFLFIKNGINKISQVKRGRHNNKSENSAHAKRVIALKLACYIFLINF